MSPRRWAENLALTLATVAVVLLLAEAASRAFARVGPTLIVKDPRLGKRYVASFSGPVFVPEAGHEVLLRFNRDGFRGPDRPEVPPAGVRRMAVLGDSMTVAVATDEERTFVRLLEKELNHTGAWEVLNLAVSSSSTGQELVYDREVAARYQPEVVVLAFYVGNDLADNSVRLTRAPRLYFDLDPQGRLALQSIGPAKAPVADWLDQHSRFYVWQKTAFAALRARLRAVRGTMDVGQRVFEVSDDPDLAHAWRVTEALLAALREQTAARHARLLLAIIPCAEQVEDDVWQELVARAEGRTLDRDLPERRLSEIAARLDIPLVPLADAFRTTAALARRAGQSGDLFIAHRFHLNDAGHALVADELFAALRDR